MRLGEPLLAQFKLNTHAQLIDYPKYQRQDLQIGIVHLGLGAFHRSHQAVFTDLALNKTQDTRWGICGVAFRNEALKSALNEQQGLYTNVICGTEQHFQVIGSIKHALVASSQIDQVLATIALPSVKMVSLTVTEKGYCLNELGQLNQEIADVQHDIAHIEQPKTAVGILVAGFKQRFDNQQPAFNVLACDNLPDNGDKLKSAVIAMANHINPALASWIESQALFPNTMVDCITPKTESETLNAVEANLGFSDLVPVQREPFAQWVIEDLDGFERPAWEQAGVLFTNDVAGFERAKLRILNGTHSALAYIGTLLGYETVYDAISNDKVRSFIASLLTYEIIPSIDAPTGLDLASYADDILSRYQNPAIRHLLLQIAADGSLKIPVRTLAPIEENIKAGRSIEQLSMVVAAWIRFVVARTKQGDEIADPKAQALVLAVNRFNGDVAQDIKAFLSIDGVVCQSLLENSIFIDSVVSAYHRLDDLLARLAAR
ncbi:mannitol dehydrogenase family protein [Saccharobesus litoralis]|uniref:Mannitol dehydrogenase family protein n=1 Tax=Saccharobesus litoralis TaxID=2172099 RepID=A0A2S0VPH8_9ALTE|nr:mannitol dehydrogenase family protein [Saccharobesus litoralis]AWB66093.1 mannitol dehydrogenase family protein [Saccharobesus litoralis]